MSHRDGVVRVQPDVGINFGFALIVMVVVVGVVIPMIMIMMVTLAPEGVLVNPIEVDGRDDLAFSLGLQRLYQEAFQRRTNPEDEISIGKPPGLRWFQRCAMRVDNAAKQKVRLTAFAQD